jgi:hypothetical protein
MNSADLAAVLAELFAELVAGVTKSRGPFILNSGDMGLLSSLDNLTALEASVSVNDGATLAAHAQHLRDGLALMNRWAEQGGDPFADPKWDEAWKISAVDDDKWGEIRGGLRDQANRWLQVLQTPRQLSDLDLNGMIGSIAHIAYHLGAIRQINKAARGPRGGTFA